MATGHGPDPYVADICGWRLGGPGCRWAPPKTTCIRRGSGRRLGDPGSDRHVAQHRGHPVDVDRTAFAPDQLLDLVDDLLCVAQAGQGVWPGSVQAASRPRTWLSLPKASHDPKHIDSSTISAGLNSLRIRFQKLSSRPR